MKKVIFILNLLIIFYIIPTLSVQSAAVDDSNNKVIAPGKDVIKFDIEIMGSNERITNEMLLGKVYILEFWKTTCKYCIEQMELLHDIYEKYKNKNFTIISISLDKSFSYVMDFRKEKWEMPWYHSWAEDGFNSELARKFEVERIPRLILVGRYGKVIYTNESGNEEELKRLLHEILK